TRLSPAPRTRCRWPRRCGSPWRRGGSRSRPAGSRRSSTPRRPRPSRVCPIGRPEPLPRHRPPCDPRSRPGRGGRRVRRGRPPPCPGAGEGSVTRRAAGALPADPGAHAARRGRAGGGHPRLRHRRRHDRARGRGAGRGRGRRRGDLGDPLGRLAGPRHAALPGGARVRVLIVGGGIIGCATAEALARASAEVILYERGAPGGEASSAAAGLLTAFGAGPRTQFQDLAIASWRLYPTVAADLRERTGIDVELVRRGTLYPLLDAGEIAEMTVPEPLATEFGAQILDEEQVRRQEPALSPKVRGALFVAGDHWVNADDVYLVPRPSGELLVGATVEHVGFRREVTARGVGELLAAAVDIVPALGDRALARTWYGFRPWAPDGLPILGPWPGVSGLFVATAHFRSGIMLAPITARLMAQWILEGVPSIAVTDFLPDRYVAAGRG